jgi:hypothetical protein
MTIYLFIQDLGIHPSVIFWAEATIFKETAIAQSCSSFESIF